MSNSVETLLHLAGAVASIGVIYALGQAWTAISEKLAALPEFEYVPPEDRL